MINQSLVLLVDSNQQESKTLSEHLRANNFMTVEAEDGSIGLRQFFKLHPDIVVVDLDVAGIAGWKVITRIRELSDSPIVALASNATDAQSVIQLGIDGFLVRPIVPNEVLVRLNAIGRRPSGNDEKRWIYQRNGLSVDMRSCEVLVHERPVQLTAKEYRLLTYLIKHRGWVLSHDQIVSHVWGTNYVGEKGQVKLYICYLRQKIETDPRDPKMIVTRRGLGYTFV